MERTFNAPVGRVWTALTDVNEMRQWYFDLKEFKPEIGFEFEFVVEHEGNNYHHLCKVTEVIPQKKIAYTWRYKGEPGDSLVTFELFPEGDKTRLKLTHSGIETFPKTPAYARKNFEAGWTAIIGSELKQFVERKESNDCINKHHPASSGLARDAGKNLSRLSGCRRPWRNGFRRMDSPAKVHHMDAKVGGTYKMSFTNFTTGKSHSFGGTYVELKPNERIRYTDKFDDPNMSGEMQTTMTLKKVSCGTELNIVQEGVPGRDSGRGLLSRLAGIAHAVGETG